VITERLVKIHATHCKVTRQAQARILQTCVFPAHTLAACCYYTGSSDCSLPHVEYAAPTWYSALHLSPDY